MVTDKLFGNQAYSRRGAIERYFEIGRLNCEKIRKEKAVTGILQKNPRIALRNLNQTVAACNGPLSGK
jgi:hypothetical protein